MTVKTDTDLDPWFALKTEISASLSASRSQRQGLKWFFARVIEIH
jgi:hypothetical protein